MRARPALGASRAPDERTIAAVRASKRKGEERAAGLHRAMERRKFQCNTAPAEAPAKVAKARVACNAGLSSLSAKEFPEGAHILEVQHGQDYGAIALEHA